MKSAAAFGKRTGTERFAVAAVRLEERAAQSLSRTRTTMERASVGSATPPAAPTGERYPLGVGRPPLKVGDAIVMPLGLAYLIHKLPRPARAKWWSYLIPGAVMVYFGFFFLNFLTSKISGGDLSFW
jgi:hypothetical protein